MEWISRIKTPRHRWMDILLITVFFLANLTAMAFWFNFWLYITAYKLSIPQLVMAGLNSILWIIAVFLVATDLKKHDDLDEFLAFLKKQKMLIIFIGWAFFSIFWSINPWISVYKLFLLICSTFLGLYIGYRYQIPRLLDLLFWFFSIILYFSAIQAIIQPGIGTMEEYPYFGAWCGPFWNRNHLGSLASLAGAIFLIRLVSKPYRQNKLLLVDIFNILFAIFIVYKTESATGYILTAALIGAILLAMGWMKFRHRMTKKHYLLILLLAGVGLILVAANMNFVFDLLNRKATLTGRIPMWNFLVGQVIGQSPWVGFGYGALWSIGIFREGLRFAVNWSYPLLIADNGYFDIILSVGLIGFIPFIFTFVSAWKNSIKQALASASIYDFFPVIFMLYASIANVSFSMFLETETFIWILLVAVKVAVSKRIERPASPV